MLNDQSHVSGQCTAYQIVLQFVVVSWPSHMWHLDGFFISTQLITSWSVESLMNHTPVQFSTVCDSLLSSSLAGPVALCSPTPAHVRKKSKEIFVQKSVCMNFFCLQVQCPRTSQCNILNHITKCLTNLMFTINTLHIRCESQCFRPHVTTQGIFHFNPIEHNM